MQYNLHIGVVMNIPLCCTGLPAISLPAGFEEGADGRRLPIGLQIIGKAFDEGEIIRIAHVFEQTADFACGTPPTFDKSKSQ